MIINNLEFIISTILLISILCGIFVIISKNPIISVLFLIGLFSSIAIYLITLGIGFIGLSYLLVYVGAVSILFLFILMLIDIKISELTSETSRSIPLALFISIAFNYTIIQLLPYSILKIKVYSLISIYNDYIYKMSTDIKETYFTTINCWDNNITEISDITSIGNIIYSNYSIWLIIVSIILLLAMIGAIVITRKQIYTDIYGSTL